MALVDLRLSPRPMEKGKSRLTAERSGLSDEEFAIALHSSCSEVKSRPHPSVCHGLPLNGSTMRPESPQRQAVRSVRRP